MPAPAPRPRSSRDTATKGISHHAKSRNELMGVGLVLGAGGATGAAFHAGTLLALQHDLGWTPDSAEIIVGSSAGSIVGGLLRAGLTTDDLSAWGTSAD